MPLSEACISPETAQLAETLLAEIPTYRDGEHGYLKLPIGGDYTQPLIVNEYEAHLYRGAIDCYQRR